MRVHGGPVTKDLEPPLVGADPAVQSLGLLQSPLRAGVVARLDLNHRRGGRQPGTSRGVAAELRTLPRPLEDLESAAVIALDFQRECRPFQNGGLQSGRNAIAPEALRLAERGQRGAELALGPQELTPDDGSFDADRAARGRFPDRLVQRPARLLVPAQAGCHPRGRNPRRRRQLRQPPDAGGLDRELELLRRFLVLVAQGEGLAEREKGFGTKLRIVPLLGAGEHPAEIFLRPGDVSGLDPHVAAPAVQPTHHRRGGGLLAMGELHRPRERLDRLPGGVQLPRELARPCEGLDGPAREAAGLGVARQVPPRGVSSRHAPALQVRHRPAVQTPGLFRIHSRHCQVGDSAVGRPIDRGSLVVFLPDEQSVLGQVAQPTDDVLPADSGDRGHGIGVDGSLSEHCGRPQDRGVLLRDPLDATLHERADPPREAHAATLSSTSQAALRMLKRRLVAQ